ncbi:hypothetical protein PUN28_019442 [Cardiocondyla obscurior]|uniref:Uncharacterized protein n=1 Tax=Cardiocondyla obscurior TaxID=286306 RepID=A0AAW2EBG1_9HYME
MLQDKTFITTIKYIEKRFHQDIKEMKHRY